MRLLLDSCNALHPPTTAQSSEPRIGSIVRQSDVDVALIPHGVEDTKRDRPTLGRPGKVMFVNLFRLPTPRSPLISELAD